jgi:hypothetical protein
MDVESVFHFDQMGEEMLLGYAAANIEMALVASLTYYIGLNLVNGPPGANTIISSPNGWPAPRLDAEHPAT